MKLTAEDIKKAKKILDKYRFTARIKKLPGLIAEVDHLITVFQELSGVKI